MKSKRWEMWKGGGIDQEGVRTEVYNLTCELNKHIFSENSLRGGLKSSF